MNLDWRTILCATMFGALLSSASAEDFHGYSCTEDCSGHEAGYDWAQENDISDYSECGGNSQSFIEGCQAWVDENGGSEEEDEE